MVYLYKNYIKNEMLTRLVQRYGIFFKNPNIPRKKAKTNEEINWVLIFCHKDNKYIKDVDFYLFYRINQKYAY